MQDVVFDGDCSENFIEIRDPLFLFEESTKYCKDNYPKDPLETYQDQIYIRFKKGSLKT